MAIEKHPRTRQSWEVHLVSAQTMINRAVFEMNRGGEADRRLRREPNRDYIRNCVAEASEDLASTLIVLTSVKGNRAGD